MSRRNPRPRNGDDPIIYRWPWRFGPGEFPARVHRPSRPRELKAMVRSSLRDVLGFMPEEYEPGKWSFEDEGLGFSVMADKPSFPWIRFHHAAIQDVAADERATLLDFVNALHGRSSTSGVHWWLGNTSLWQSMELSAVKFDEEVFLDHLEEFISVAQNRTPELRVRFTSGTDAAAMAPYVTLHELDRTDGDSPETGERGGDAT